MMVMARQQLDPAEPPLRQQPITEVMQRSEGRASHKPRRKDRIDAPRLVQTRLDGKAPAALARAPSREDVTRAWRGSTLQQAIHDGAPPAKRRQNLDDDDDEEIGEDVSGAIRSMFGYDRRRCGVGSCIAWGITSRRFADEADDASDMEAGFDEMEAEERRTCDCELPHPGVNARRARVGRLEDDIEVQHGARAV